LIGGMRISIIDRY